MPQNLFGVKNPIFALAGTNILASFVAQATPMQVGRNQRIRFHTAVVLANGSPITSVTVKLQRRYNDFDPTSPTQLAFTDLYSTCDSNQATSPVGTYEVSHTLGTLAAPIAAPGKVLDWFLDYAYGLLDLQLLVQANAQGIAGDSVTTYAVSA